ncbi:succinate dehydrogenase hydrophobic membrane anchor subunit [Brachybacterium sp. DNPG3]
MTAKTTPSPAIPDPTTRYRRTGLRGPNVEMLSWMFMRASGVLLVILVFGHLFVNLWLGEGVQGIDFAFVAGKWASPFWQVWDLLMLWLGLIHGANGVRTIINDYARGPRLRLGLKALLYLAVIVTIVLGTLVIFTFSPCPPGADPSLLPSICKG